MATTTFIKQCLEGSAQPDEIDDFVDRWHANEAGKAVDLRNFLGMTKIEYAAWMRNPKELQIILQDRVLAG